MARDLVDHNKPVFDHVHPRIYTTAIGFVVWFAVAAWLARGTCTRSKTYWSTLRNALLRAP
jgi:hypothetical protein